MKVVKEHPGDVAAVVLTGDGRAEYRRLRYLAEHYDENQHLFFPQRPDRNLSIVGRQRETPNNQTRGFDALNALKIFKAKYGLHHFLFLTDREHVKNSPQEDLNNKLEEISTRGEYTTSRLEQAAFSSSVKVGSKELTVLSAIIGDQFECMEDGLAALLKHQWGNEVTAESRKELKSNVMQVLSGGTEKTLIEDASRYNLKRSFPNLDCVLTTFE
ncbi:hypothetical protein ACFQJC_09120 [Haloferax namakaokahaiae]|uniref:Uncharacterized protein n=1 Tax=Haloferax namakaokahaiae TaxID=1748331 RepID=A0ABD5ZEY8_9EURY